MGQGAMSMLGGGTSTAPPVPDTSVGYTPQGPAGTPTAASSGGTPLGQGPAGGDPQATAANLKNNLGIMQKFTNLLGKDPEEREKNAKIFAALVKDLGNVGKSMMDSTLMQRMMSEQMGGIQVVDQGGSPSGGVGPIPRSDYSQPIMPPGGFR